MTVIRGQIVSKDFLINQTNNRMMLTVLQGSEFVFNWSDQIEAALPPIIDIPEMSLYPDDG